MCSSLFWFTTLNFRAHTTQRDPPGLYRPHKSMAMPSSTAAPLSPHMDYYLLFSRDPAIPACLPQSHCLLVAPGLASSIAFCLFVCLLLFLMEGGLGFSSLPAHFSLSCKSQITASSRGPQRRYSSTSFHWFLTSTSDESLTLFSGHFVYPPYPPYTLTLSHPLASWSKLTDYLLTLAPQKQNKTRSILSLLLIYSRKQAKKKM